MNSDGSIQRNPITGEPKWSCCKFHSSIRAVTFHEFSDLGPGLALTFRLMQVGGWFFLAAFVLSVTGWIVQLSNPKDVIWVNTSWICDLIFTLGFIVWMCWLRRDMMLHTREVDAKDITASDYTVKVENVPSDATADELALYFAQFGTLYTAVDIVTNLYDNDFDRTGVSIVRNDSSFISAAYDLEECRLEQMKTDPDNEMAQTAVVEKLDYCQEQYDRLRHVKFKKWYHCSGTAFVTFMYQDGRDSCLQGLKRGFFQYHLTHEPISKFNNMKLNLKLTPPTTPSSTRVERTPPTSPMSPTYPTLPTSPTPSSTTTQTKNFRLTRNGHTKLSVSIANDPNDLLWRNLSNSKCNIFCRQLSVGTFSFCYLVLISWVMAFFAAHAREWQVLPGAPVNLGLLAVLGNVLCFVTSIVLFMPLLSVLEGVHSRSTLQIIAFLKLSFFQFAATMVGTVYVYGLDEYAADGRAFTNEQFQAFGSGLPTTNCNIRRFTRWRNVTPEFIPLGK
jgi:hypothetical protein